MASRRWRRARLPTPSLASAIAKVLKEKGGLEHAVQATAGETVLIPMVGVANIDLGIANMLEVLDAVENGRQSTGASSARSTSSGPGSFARRTAG